MSNLCIYLGSSSNSSSSSSSPGSVDQNDHTTTGTDAERVVQSAIDLAQAATAVEATKVWKALTITVLASEVATAFGNPMSLASFKLDDEAEVTVHILDNDNDANATSNWSSNIHTAFLLAGLQGTSEKRDSNGARVLTALKKNQTSQMASAKAVALPKRIPTTTGTPVTLSLDDDMINEDDLLQDEGDLAPDMNGFTTGTSTTTNGGADENDCGGRTACDDCTCGRAELEQQQASGVMIAPNKKAEPIKTSACGKCGLGDAFRCASCPFLGKPAFKAGQEHLVLELQDDF